MNDLRNYFMKPKKMKNDLEVYPVKIPDYEDFKLLANKYILLDIPQINNKRKQDKMPKLEQKTLFDYLIALANHNYGLRHLIYELETMDKKDYDILASENEQVKELMSNKQVLKQLKEDDHEKAICKLFEMVLHKKVVYNNRFGNFDVLDEEGRLTAMINNRNLPELRDIIMEQNILFTPRVSSNKKSQDILDKEVEKLFGKGSSSLESMVAIVSQEYNQADISEFTYYRLRADFTVIMRKLGVITNSMYRASGSKNKDGSDIEIPNLVSDLEMNVNPFNQILKQSKETSLDKRLANQGR